MDETVFVYDKTITVSYGLWVCPDCGAMFYGGGRTMHDAGCSLLPNTMDYSGLEFHFGPKQVEQVKENGEWYGLSLAALSAEFPELVADNATP